MIPKTSVTPTRTAGTESLAKYYKCGTIITKRSGETILMNLANDSIDAVLTSFSASLKRFVNIYIKETSSTLPKASANSANI